MRNALVLSSLIASTLVLAAGCTPRPVSIRAINQSELPAEAKALVSNDSQITAVEQARYGKGNVDYIIRYRAADGTAGTVKYGDYSQTTPTGVFERFEIPETGTGGK